MTEALQEAYKRIADRHLEMAGQLIQSHPEGAVFHCYHAFESIASAALLSFSTPVPRAHRSKLDTFIARSRSYRFARGAFAVTLLLETVRAGALYPEQIVDSQVVHPESRWQVQQVAEIHRRVSGIVRQIAQDLGL